MKRNCPSAFPGCIFLLLTLSARGWAGPRIPNVGDSLLPSRQKKMGAAWFQALKAKGVLGK